MNSVRGEAMTQSETMSDPQSSSATVDAAAGAVWQGGETEASIGRRWIDAATLRTYAGPNVWRWLAGVATEWLIIAGAMWICTLSSNPLLWIAAIFVIGTRQHALGIMAHEGVHYLVLRSKRWNDLLSNLLCAYPLTYSIEGYRTNHLEHHRWLETPRDPEQAAINSHPADWTFPMSRSRYALLLVRDMVGGSIRQMFELAGYIWTMPGGALRHKIYVALFHAAFIALALLTGHIWTYLLLWLVPLSTVAVMCFRIRTVAEHSAVHPAASRYRLQHPDTLATTRTTVYGPLAKFFFGPHNMAYHIEHHMFPSVPVFNLKGLHEHLMRNPDYSARAHVSASTGALIAELTAEPTR
jgi:fatty acid desaturase